jgi:hypothetical protein
MSCGWRLAVAATTVAACSDITVTPGGVAAIELSIPHPAQIEVRQVRRLSGRAVGERGDSLPIRLVWYALDTTLAIDSLEGLLTGRFPGSGRVLARAADLYSRTVQFQVLPAVDTLIQVSPAVVTVAGAEFSTPDLRVRAAAGSDLAGVSGREVRYAVTRPLFPDERQRTVELSTGALTATALTASNGEAALRLRRRAGFAAPDSAEVTVTLRRPGGEPVPGSGLRFVVRFAAP